MGCGKLTRFAIACSKQLVVAAAPQSDSLNEEQHWPAEQVPLPGPQSNAAGCWQYELSPENIC